MKITSSKIKKTEKKPEKILEKERYVEGIGRRKTSVARVRFFAVKSQEGKKIFNVNEKPLEKYFPLKKQQELVLSPLSALSIKNYEVTVKVKGGGLSAQAEAIRLGLSRALVLISPTNRPRLKALGFLTRDPRRVERKKFGSRKARRPQQWRKR